MKLRLTVELVPQTCWFSNVRSAVSKSRWDTIRKQVYDQAWHVCQICGGVGNKHPVEAHEIWSYDDEKLIQKLEGMIALCPPCHAVKHFGFSCIRGKEERTLLHLMRVNNFNQKQAQQYIEKTFKLWEKRSQKEWKLDISHLLEYGIDISKIKERK